MVWFCCQLNHIEIVKRILVNIALIGEWIFRFSLCNVFQQHFLRHLVQRQSLTVENVLVVNAILATIRAVKLKQINRLEHLAKFAVHTGLLRVAYPIPELDVEAKVDVSVLMMVVVEDCVWLPGLPPVCLKCDARVVENCVVVCVQTDSVK